ncbi:MAG: CRISPR-associated protein Csx15 [Anaerolineae bacterium]|nr:CRISPR-associated protein Csx15 [Anaerolineae bacterium]MDW8101803.1 CRISPR-associated protein Csx15 [Anaerolineae bacterium]
MILINFSHPLTQEHIAQIESFIRQRVEKVVEIPTQIDPQQPLVPQVRALADAAGFSPVEWQTLPILINPPSLNFIAVVLLAELHGRMGYFPPIIRMRPVVDEHGNRVVPPRFEVAEVIDLQTIREEARKRRQ